MDCHDHIIVESERKRGQHLGQEERGAIQQLSKLGYSLRSIAAKIDCSASTVLNELRRGTPKRKSAKGRTPEYSAKRGLQCMKQTECEAGGAIASIIAPLSSSG